MCDATEKIAADCNNILAFLQAIVVKAPQVSDVPLFLRADKRVGAWFRRFSAHHIAPLSRPLAATP